MVNRRTLMDIACSCGPTRVCIFLSYRITLEQGFSDWSIRRLETASQTGTSGVECMNYRVCRTASQAAHSQRVGAVPHPAALPAVLAGAAGHQGVLRHARPVGSGPCLAARDSPRDVSAGRQKAHQFRVTKGTSSTNLPLRF